MISLLDKAIEAHLLYDCYSPMLTERQRETFELHYFEDFSLAEIADHLAVSRQAVHDILHRTMQQLFDYEQKLHVLSSMQKRKATAQTLAARLRTLGIVDEQVFLLVQELM